MYVLDARIRMLILKVSFNLSLASNSWDDIWIACFKLKDHYFSLIIIPTIFSCLLSTPVPPKISHMGVNFSVRNHS